jgi:hypothetical protein
VETNFDRTCERQALRTMEGVHLKHAYPGGGQRKLRQLRGGQHKPAPVKRKPAISKQESNIMKLHFGRKLGYIFILIFWTNFHQKTTHWLLWTMLFDSKVF